MKRRQRYIVITVAVVTVLVVSITLGVVLGGSENSKSESRLAASDTGEPTFSPFITPNATLNTVPPSLRPTVRPEENFTEFPSLDPTVETNYSETLQPSNFSFSPAPSYNSTEWPTLSPSVDLNSTMLPSVSTAPSYWNENAPNKTSSVPSLQPSLMPTFLKPPKSKTPEPSSYPSLSPTRLADGDGKIASIAPTGHDSEKLHDPASGTRFYAIGDVPYTSKEARELKVQIDNLPQDAEFVIHVGDIRSAKNGKKCEIQEYHEVAAILNQSHAPVFLVLGDNEWNDCPNVNQGFQHWMTVFGRFDEHWNHSFSLVRHDNRTENFAFVHKRTLFFGLNLVGGRVHHGKDWKERLTDLYEWVKVLVDSKVLSNQPEADSVVIFGHADPSRDHDDFFDPLTDYLKEDLVSDVPFLYLNGDSHVWNYKEQFYRQPNFLRMQVEGGTREPPLQVSLNNSNARMKPVSEVFNYNRMLRIIEI